eukprot:jgi/Orpsp1_1/1190496/evm.model.d7180000079387.1
MKLFNSFILIFWISHISFCYAKVEDYLKGIKFKRSFSSIEGKVIDFNITMTEEDYNGMVQSSQLSFQEFYANYHGYISDEMKFSTKVNVNNTVDDQVYSYEKVKLKVGGNNSRTYDKVGFNLKLKKEKFFGRNNLRLRPDYTDITHIRSKLAVDLINKWNIPTVQETYANVYINNRYFGFYIFLDAIKSGWVHDIYQIPEEEDIKTLYSCSRQTFKFDPDTIRNVCQNEKEEYLNYTQPLYDMVDEIYEYTSLKQLKRKFNNVENIRKILIYEYLFGTTDNFIMTGNNYDFYQSSNGKWDFIPLDYSLIFLNSFDVMLQYIPYQIPKKEKLIDYAKVKFEEWHASGTRKPFIDILYYQDKKTFVKVLKELLITGFNPDELFPRIDELSEFVAPYVERDLTPDENGQLPGRINLKGVPVQNNMEKFWACINDDNYNGNFGLKKYFQVKFDSVCELYGINKKEILLKAKIYRQKRALEIKLYDLKQEINELKDKIAKASKKNKTNYQKKINKLSCKINHIQYKLKNIKVNY